MSPKRILIAEDDSDLAYTLGLHCRRLGLEVFRSPDAMHALMGAHRARPDVILLDVNLPSGNGLSVCEMLLGDRELATIPIIVMSGAASEETQRRCRELRVTFVQKGPRLWEELSPLICQATELECEQPERAADDSRPAVADEAPARSRRPKVLCVDDDAEISKLIKVRLDPLGIDVIRAFSGMQGYWSCLDTLPAVVITDLKMPDGEGHYFFYRLKQHPLTEKIPVVVLTGMQNPAMRRQLLSQGVDAYLTKPLVFSELVAILKQHIDLPELEQVGRPATAMGRST